MRIRLLGIQWNLKFVANLGKNKDGVPYLGHCDHPGTSNKTIKVLSNLAPAQELDVTIHELIHALLWNHDEEFVNNVGKDLSEILWKLGYRKLTKEQRKQLDID